MSQTCFEAILGHRSGRPALLAGGADPSVRRPQGHGRAHGIRTNGWNSSATGCWACRWPSGWPNASRASRKATWAAGWPIWSPSRCWPVWPKPSAWRRALSVSPGEAKAGVAKRATVLADALEAALGALYLDGGLDAARDFVRRAWNDAMTDQAEPPKDAKTALQEWAQKRGAGSAGLCESTGRSGPPHAPEFTVTVTVGGIDRQTAPPATSAPRSNCAAEALLAQAAGMTAPPRDTMRLRRHRRRAERRQVHADEPPDRRQTVDRVAEGADDAVPRPRHPDARRHRRSCWSIRPASSGPSASSTGRWWRRPGPAPPTPTWRCCWSMRVRACETTCATSPSSWARPAGAAGWC